MGADPVYATRPDPLWYYESIAAASASMLHAAQEGDWDALVEQEKACATLIEALSASGAERQLSDDTAKRKGAILRQLLAEDAEIRRLTQPWLRRLEELLHASANERRLGDTYR